MFDLIIRHGKIIDGSGEKSSFHGDIGVKNGTILEIGDLENEVAETEIDAKGKFVTPGFIDLNNHSDTYLTLFHNPDQTSLVLQGITTIFGGNCGSSLAPILGEGSIKSLRKWVKLRNVQIDWDRMGEFLDYLESNRPLRLNFGTLVGHATLRRGLLGEEIRPLAEKELATLQREVKRAISEGAWGFSTGLAYTHTRVAEKQEILSLAKTVEENNGIFTVHLRGEREDLILSVKEAIAIAEETGVNLEISHLKAIGKTAWRAFGRALNLIDDARKRGANINFDIYPYTFSNPVLYTLLPPIFTEGNRETILKNLRNPEKRKEIVSQMREDSVNYSQILIASSPLSELLVKKNIAEIAKSRDTSPEEVIIDLILASEDQCTVIVKLLSEKNVKDAIACPSAIICSDGAGYSLEDTASGNLIHPRSFGAFPRFLAHYVKNKKILSPQKAIHRITGLPAKKIGLPKRGQIKEGYHADIVVLDWDKISDTATLEKPYAYPKGIDYVIVNGQLTAKMGELVQGVRSGEILRK